MDFGRPNIDDTIEDFFSQMSLNFGSLATWLDGTTNQNAPAGAKRYSSANRRFEKTTDGTSWGELLPKADPELAYDIRVSIANVCSGNSATADLATNSNNLGGVPAANYALNTDSRFTDSRKCNNTFDDASASRSNLSVYSKSEANTLLAAKANLESPTFTGSPTAPTQAYTDTSTKIANTAFVNGNKTYIGGVVSLAPYFASGWENNGSFAVPFYNMARNSAAPVAIHFYINATGSGAGQSILSLTDDSFLQGYYSYIGSDEYVMANTALNLAAIFTTATSPNRLILRMENAPGGTGYSFRIIVSHMLFGKNIA